LWGETGRQHAYNLAHTLLARAGTCLFVPIRSLQYMAVLDAEEFVFGDSQNKAWVELAWQHFRPQARSALNGRVPFEVVHYAPRAAQTMKRLPHEFLQSLQGLATPNRPPLPPPIAVGRHSVRSRRGNIMPGCLRGCHVALLASSASTEI
jgi:hypothetical protein